MLEEVLTPPLPAPLFLKNIVVALVHTLLVNWWFPVVVACILYCCCFIILFPSSSSSSSYARLHALFDFGSICIGFLLHLLERKKRKTAVVAVFRTQQPCSFFG